MKLPNPRALPAQRTRSSASMCGIRCDFVECRDWSYVVNVIYVLNVVNVKLRDYEDMDLASAISLKYSSLRSFSSSITSSFLRNSSCTAIFVHATHSSAEDFAR